MSVAGFEPERRSGRVIRFVRRSQASGEQHPDTVDIRFTARSADKPAEIIIRSAQGVLPSDIKRLPWTRWIDLARFLVREDPDNVVAKFGGYPDGIVMLEESSPPPPPPKRPGRRGHVEDHYRGVADRYQAARAQGRRDPTAQIASAFHVSRSTAAGWVRACRERGYLGPARRGQAG